MKVYELNAWLYVKHTEWCRWAARLSVEAGETWGGHCQHAHHTGHHLSHVATARWHQSAFSYEHLGCKPYHLSVQSALIPRRREWSYTRRCYSVQGCYCHQRVSEALGHVITATQISTESDYFLSAARWRKLIGMIDDYDESSGWMFLLVPAHPGFPGQIPQSRKTVVLCVCVVEKIQTLPEQKLYSGDQKVSANTSTN